jgi:hypothetical protein
MNEEIEKFVNKHSRKMWLSMISRLGLSLDMWEILRYKNIPIYASRTKCGDSDWIIHTDKCLTCGSNLKLHSLRGSFFVKLSCKCGTSATKSWTKERLRCLISDDDHVQRLLGEIIDKKTSRFPGREIFWTSQGYSPEDAKKKVSEWQKQQRDKSPITKGSRDHSVRCVEYYLKNGQTLEEAREAIKKIQTTNGLDWYIDRYGEELGKILFEDRIDRWLDSYYSRDDINSINLSKGRTRQQHIDKNGIEWYNEFQIASKAKMTQTKVSKGLITDPCLKSDKIIYYEKISSFTGYSIRNHYDLINPHREKIANRQFHVDHIFSRKDGFLNQIMPEIIGCPLNLRVVWWQDNLSKGGRSEFTIEQLLENYEKSKIEYGYPY